MILTGAKSIRDVILFPLMRPAKSADGDAKAEGSAADAPEQKPQY
jgi:aspartyl-tRNA synthetase